MCPLCVWLIGPLAPPLPSAHLLSNQITLHLTPKFHMDHLFTAAVARGNGRPITTVTRIPSELIWREVSGWKGDRSTLRTHLWQYRWLLSGWCRPMPLMTCCWTTVAMETRLRGRRLRVLHWNTAQEQPWQRSQSRSQSRAAAVASRCAIASSYWPPVGFGTTPVSAAASVSVSSRLSPLCSGERATSTVTWTTAGCLLEGSVLDVFSRSPPQLWSWGQESSPFTRTASPVRSVMWSCFLGICTVSRARASSVRLITTTGRCLCHRSHIKVLISSKVSAFCVKRQ